MEKELEKYYEGQFDMTSSDAWKDFLATVQVMIKKDENILTVKDTEELFKRQGRLDILNWVNSWRDVCEATWKGIANEEDL